MDKPPAHSNPWLMPLAGVYSLVVRARNRYYDAQRGAAHDASVPVISVGNITTGGTGKTPLTIVIAARLRSWGRRPVILTRGYAAPRGRPADEVLELREALPEIPVVVDADRVRGAAAAVRDHNADCLLLDDGFQHRRLRRALDLVLIDALDPWGGAALLPAGRLREPREALRRADALVITRANLVDGAIVQSLRAELARRAASKPVLCCDVVASRLVAADGSSEAPDTLANTRVLAVCGIGNPNSFLRVLANTGAQLCQPLFFKDHHRYKYRDLDLIRRQLLETSADRVVTTRKDWVKLAALQPSAHGLEGMRRLETHADLSDSDGELDKLLRHALETRFAQTR